jgi:hypothetical protein
MLGRSANPIAILFEHDITGNFIKSRVKLDAPALHCTGQEHLGR